MLSERMTKRLNEQINLEFYSSNLYLQMGAWCEANGMEGCQAFLSSHADEEMAHMRRLFGYVADAGGMPQIGAIDAPRSEFGSVREIFEATLEHERFVTSKINDLADTAFQEKDYSTFNFIQWYVAEQHEEEKLFSSILDRVKMIGSDGRGLFFIDREIGRLAAARKTGQQGGEGVFSGGEGEETI